MQAKELASTMKGLHPSFTLETPDSQQRSVCQPSAKLVLDISESLCNWHIRHPNDAVVLEGKCKSQPVGSIQN
jgi:hypothetical protein